MEKQVRDALRILPPQLREGMERFLSQRELLPEEIRLRAGRPITVVSCGSEQTVTWKGTPLLTEPQGLLDTLAAATGYSRYAVQEELAQGWCILEGGHRLGVCGEGVMEGKRLTGFRFVSSLDLRIARAHPGCADPLLPYLKQAETGLLLGGQPGVGKTTVLRDAVRLLSDALGQRVGLADERGELAACSQGCPGLDVGAHTDVITGVPKETGIWLLLRTMAPQWIAVDEVSCPEDAQALIRAAYSGAKLLATVHLSQAEDLDRRPVYRELLSCGFFTHLALIRPDRSITVERIRQ